MVYCRECGQLHLLGAYTFMEGDEIVYEDGFWKSKRILFSICPNKVKRRLGECEKFGCKRDELISEENWAKIIDAVDEYDEGYME